MGKKITEAELKKHTKEGDVWMALYGKVYNLTEFLDEHPGGEGVILAYSGQDSTEQFESVVHSDVAKELLEDYYIGDLVKSGGGGGGGGGSSGGWPGIIVVGSGLSGTSAAVTCTEAGIPVMMFEKEKRLGGNSVKAWAGYNGSLTSTQSAQGIKDSNELFSKDTAIAAFKTTKVAPGPFHQKLARDSGPGFEWMKSYGIELPILSQNGGHSAKRTHRCERGGAGSYITNSLLRKFRQMVKANPEMCQLKKKTRVTKLIANDAGAVVGVEWEAQDGTKGTQTALAVVLCTGGFAGGISREGNKSLMHEYRPDLVDLPTSNPESATGDGFRIARELGADECDMMHVQIHPTGFIHPDKPVSEQHELTLATEALRGHGALLINSQGRRFVNEQWHRDWVTNGIRAQTGDCYVVMNSGVAKDAEKPFVKQYTFLGVLQRYASGREFCNRFDIPYDAFCESLKVYNQAAKRGYCDSGKIRFDNTPFDPEDKYVCGIITPLLHYVMGGIKINTSGEVIHQKGHVIPGLFCGGEASGGVHGKNRLAGNSLVDCVVYGRQAGKSACQYAKGGSSKL